MPSDLRRSTSASSQGATAYPSSAAAQNRASDAGCGQSMTMSRSLAIVALSARGHAAGCRDPMPGAGDVPAPHGGLDSRWRCFMIVESSGGMEAVGRLWTWRVAAVVYRGHCFWCVSLVGCTACFPEPGETG